jgi:hypothetical protein
MEHGIDLSVRSRDEVEETRLCLNYSHCLSS